MAMKLADYLIESPIYAAGQRVGMAGADTSPVRSPMEGLARALQGGIGGWMVGQGMKQARDERGADSEALAAALDKFGKGDVTGATSILATRPNLGDTAAAIGMQTGMLAYKQKLEGDQQDADAARFGFPSMRSNQQQPGSVGPAPVSPSVLDSHFEAASKATGLPVELLKRVAGTESNFNPNAVSPAGAGGVMQLMPGTAQGLGVQNVFDAGKNIMGGAQYLRQQIDKYGNLPHALAAYNWGPGNVDGWLKAGGDPSRLPAETQGYISKIAGGAQPQQSLNVPAQNGDTINYQGLQLPRAALVTALSIRDHGERQKAIMSVVTDAVKSQREGVPLERVRQPDGSEIIVPRTNAAGMVAAPQTPNAGGKEGDVALLTQAMKDPSMLQDPTTRAAVKAAYDRQAQPQQSHSGQLLYPNMSAYESLGFGRAPDGVTIRDTPQSQFQMSGKLADDFNQLKPVKDYREVAPIMESMRDAATRNSRVADLNLVYGLAKIMDPTSVVREGEQIMVRNAQSLPDWMRGMIQAANGGSQFVPEQRARIIQEAESRVGALKSQYDAVVQQFTERGQRYGLDPRDIVTNPGGAQTQQQAPAAVPVYDLNGKRIK